MENEMLKLNENGLLSKIMEAGAVTMKIVLPAASFEEAKDKITKIPEDLGQYIQCEFNGKVFNFVPDFSNSKEVEEKSKETPKDIDRADSDADDAKKRNMPASTFSGKVPALILSLLNAKSEGMTGQEITKDLGYKSYNNIYESLKKLAKLKLIQKTGRDKKITITKEGKSALEEYERKKGKVELPEKSNSKPQEFEPPEKQHAPDEEKIAVIQKMKENGDIISPETVSSKLNIGLEVATMLIKKSEN